jgi:hypothetical protein
MEHLLNALAFAALLAAQFLAVVFVGSQRKCISPEDPRNIWLSSERRDHRNSVREEMSR